MSSWLDVLLRTSAPPTVLFLVTIFCMVSVPTATKTFEIISYSSSRKRRNYVYLRINIPDNSLTIQFYVIPLLNVNFNSTYLLSLK